MNDALSERTIEDILSSDKSILAEILSASPANLSLVGRQRNVKSGKLDLLYLYEDQLLLIELKVVPFEGYMIGQINAYSGDLRELQEQHKLIEAPIAKVLLVTDARSEDVEKCDHESIRLLTYQPSAVLSKYYEVFKQRSYFLQIRSGDYGVVRLGLLNSTLSLLSHGLGIQGLCESEGKSQKTIRNRLSVATLLGLTAKFRREFFLSDLGTAFVEAADDQAGDRLSERQRDLLAGFMLENPFFSSVTYTVFSMIESIFTMARNSYPVPVAVVQDYFVRSVGKPDTWKTEKARKTATYIFSNYACELDFLAKVGGSLYMTPKGTQAILLLQLNRSLKLIESQR